MCKEYKISDKYNNKTMYLKPKLKKNRTVSFKCIIRYNQRVQKWEYLINVKDYGKVRKVSHIK